MRLLPALIFVASIAAGGCFMDGTDSATRNSNHDDVGQDGGTGDCQKIEGEAIGQAGVELTVGDIHVTFVSWTPKTDSPGEYVGFELQTSANVVFYVKSGNDVVEGSGTTWLNANGDSGSDAKGISNVEVCDPDPGADPDPNPDPDPNGDCNNPDGCDGGPGGTTDGGDPPIVN